MANKLPIIIIVVVAIVVSVFYSLYLVAFIASLFILYRLVAPLLSISVFNSRFLRWVVTIFFYMLLLQGIILTSWFLFRDSRLDFSILIGFLVISILSLVTKKRNQQTVPVVNRLDVISIIAALMIGASTILSSPTIAASIFGGNWDLLISGADDKSHIRLLSEKIVHNRGVVYQTDSPSDFGLSGYPVGWHSSHGAIFFAVDPTIASDHQLSFAYMISKLFWFFVLLFVFCRVTLALARRISKNTLSLIGVLWIISALYIIGRIFISDVYISGFYNYMPQLISLLLSLLLILQYSEVKRSDERVGYLFLMITFIIGGVLPWMLPLPALGITVLGLVGTELYRTRSMIPLVQLVKKPLFITSLAFLAIGALAQLFVMFTTKAENTNPFFERLNFDGGVITNGMEFYIFLILGTAIYLTLQYRKIRQYATSILWLLVPLLTFAGLIAVFQLLTIGHNNYYFYKLLNVGVTIMLPLFIAGFYWAITKLENKNRWLALILFLALFITCLIFFVRATLHIFEAGIVAL